MKPLSGLSRNDAIKCLAVASIVIFPLIAHAQLGRGSDAVKASQVATPVADAAVKTAAARADSCADQHWPFLSAGCLRESTRTVEPRLISMNVEPRVDSAATDAAKPARVAAIVRDKDPSVGSKKPAKPRTASHRRERTAPGINYAVNLEANHTSMPGW